MSEASTVAVLFPGQGAQRPGMARDFFLAFEAARHVFATASDALGVDLAALCFDDDPRLNLTEFTQPALLTAELAMYRGLAEAFGVKAEIFAGHSVGEYTALVAAGVLPLSTAVQLLRLRGRLMQGSGPAGAVLVVRAAAALERVPAERLAKWGVDLACENSPEQIVLAGPTRAIELAASGIVELFGKAGAELVRLNVSAAFHSRQMRAIEPGLRAALLGISDRICASRAACVLSNFTGDFHAPNTAALVDALVLQVSSTVRWTENMKRVAACAARVYEVGPGRALTGLFASTGGRAVSLSSLATARRQLEHAA
jgi:malonyl CoA-acyl carrier protein transacylase